jgi:RNA-directed DNA polymerase
VPCAVGDPKHVRRHFAREPGDPRSARVSRDIRPQREPQGDTPLMDRPGKSDRSVVPEKLPNKVEEPTAEVVEGREWAKANLREQNASRTQSRSDAHSALERVRAAAQDKKQRFTALLHHVCDVERLRAAYFEVKKNAAAGVDGETWRHYGKGLEVNLQ